jgi:hypothetical protein
MTGAGFEVRAFDDGYGVRWRSGGWLSWWVVLREGVPYSVWVAMAPVDHRSRGLRAEFPSLEAAEAACSWLGRKGVRS